MIRTTQAALVEYSLSIPPLTLAFEFNPKQFSRTRTVTLKTVNPPGAQGGYDFASPTDTARVAQGAEVEPETLSIEILLDATDRMDRGDPIATQFGIGPELDTLRRMVEPKGHGPGGVSSLAGLGFGGSRAFQRQLSASVLLFVWGTHILPVFLTSVQVEEKAHLPSLTPYRAYVTLGMQVIEGNNPFYDAETARQVQGAALNTGATAASGLGRLF